MTTLNPATRLSSAELAVTRVGPQIRVRLPADGWHVGFRAQHDGRTVIEVTGQDGSLAGLVASSRLPVLSVDAGWRIGCCLPAGLAPDREILLGVGVSSPVVACDRCANSASASSWAIASPRSSSAPSARR